MESSSPLPDLPEYSRAQLALRNGQDRDEIWVSYQGLIYDVTRSRLWRRGNHYEHWAGQDLTRELDVDAPHTPNVFDRFPVIGRLKAAAASARS
jgi:predicted heme/steroid binding protein